MKPQDTSRKHDVFPAASAGRLVMELSLAGLNCEKNSITCEGYLGKTRSKIGEVKAKEAHRRKGINSALSEMQLLQRKSRTNSTDQESDVSISVDKRLPVDMAQDSKDDTLYTVSLDEELKDDWTDRQVLALDLIARKLDPDLEPESDRAIPVTTSSTILPNWVPDWSASATSTEANSDTPKPRPPRHVWNGKAAPSHRKTTKKISSGAYMARMRRKDPPTVRFPPSQSAPNTLSQYPEFRRGSPLHPQHPDIWTKGLRSGPLTPVPSSTLGNHISLSHVENSDLSIDQVQAFIDSGNKNLDDFHGEIPIPIFEPIYDPNPRDQSYFTSEGTSSTRRK
ncbi:uncharacterized protein RSE6_01377 [Rhynchosporium secalis]|uniref:Uncharacterized protein n=1 Tax=Rhynchosporium secalis TaxID=38038 RepID=A0A1E1LXM2_RHYSE|nr:uncharacterized protein RSE6_01377 [Rhynchosporium secalis]